jgi:hypothetical protein
MNNNHVNKILGIFTGTAIGAIVGHNLIQYGSWLMFVAPIIGALITSFIVAPKTTWNIIKIAWKTTCVEVPCWIYNDVDWSTAKTAVLRLVIGIGGIILIMISTYLSLEAFTLYKPLVFENSVPVLPILIINTILPIITVISFAGEGGIDKEYRYDWGGIKPILKYFNTLAVIFWIFWLSFKGLKNLYKNHRKYWSKITSCFWYIIKFTARLSVNLESGLSKYGLAVGALSATIGAFIGQFQSQCLYGGLIGISTYSIIHLVIWFIAVFAKALPKRILQ